MPPEPLRNILERISDGFVAFDMGMNYTYVDQKGGEILGRKPEDLVTFLPVLFSSYFIGPRRARSVFHTIEENHKK